MACFVCYRINNLSGFIELYVISALVVVCYNFTFLVQTWKILAVMLTVNFLHATFTVLHLKNKLRYFPTLLVRYSRINTL